MESRKNRKARVAIVYVACIAGTLGCASIAGMSGCAAQEVATDRAGKSENQEIAREAFERWQAGTGGPFELLHEHAVWTIVGSSPYSRTYRGREAFMSEVIRPFNARLTEPLKPTVRAIVADGDTVVVLFDAEAMAKDGIAYRNTYSWHLRMREGQIVEAVAFFDTRLFDEFWQRVAPTG